MQDPAHNNRQQGCGLSATEMDSAERHSNQVSVLSPWGDWYTGNLFFNEALSESHLHCHGLEGLYHGAAVPLKTN